MLTSGKTFKETLLDKFCLITKRKKKIEPHGKENSLNDSSEGGYSYSHK